MAKQTESIAYIRTDLISVDSLIALSIEQGNDLYAERLEDWVKKNAAALELGIPYVRACELDENGNLLATPKKLVDSTIENKRRALNKKSSNKKLSDAFFGTGQVTAGDFLLECKTSILTNENYSIDFDFEKEQKAIIATKDPSRLCDGAKRLG
jgi:hypothetical protein